MAVEKYQAATQASYACTSGNGTILNEGKNKERKEPASKVRHQGSLLFLLNCDIEVLDKCFDVYTMHCCDILDFLKGCGKTADTADVVLHKNHCCLRVRVNDFFYRHLFGNLLFTHDFTYFVISRYNHLAYKDSYDLLVRRTGRWDPAKRKDFN